MKCPKCGHEPFDVGVQLRCFAEGEINAGWNLEVEKSSEEIETIKCLNCGAPIDVNRIKGWTG